MEPTIPPATAPTSVQMQPSRARRFVLMLPALCAIVFTILLLVLPGMEGMIGVAFGIFVGFPAVIITGINLYLASYHYQKTSLIIWCLWSVAMLAVITAGGLFRFV